MWWPFKKPDKEIPKSPRRPVVQIVVRQEIDRNDQVVSGIAYFSSGTPSTTMAPVPIDALGQLALDHPDRLNMDLVDPSVCDFPNAETAKPGRIYFGAKEQAGGGWIASMRGLNFYVPVCKHKPEGIDIRQTKVWETAVRAIGMLIAENMITTHVLVLSNAKHPIKLPHPSDTSNVTKRPNSKGAHCACSGGR